MPADITLDELHAEYARLGATTQAKGLTSKEIQARLGIGDEQARRFLHRAKAAGVLRHGRKAAERLDGMRILVPCYWFERAKPGKKK